MASFDYAKMAATAGRLLERFGKTVTITRTTGGTYDPVTGAATPGTPETFEPKGILTKYPDNLIDGTRIQMSDRKLILDDTVMPTMDDKPTIQGEEWTIKDIETVSPAGTPLIYFVQVRR